MRPSIPDPRKAAQLPANLADRLRMRAPASFSVDAAVRPLQANKTKKAIVSRRFFMADLD